MNPIRPVWREVSNNLSPEIAPQRKMQKKSARIIHGINTSDTHEKLLEMFNAHHLHFSKSIWECFLKKSVELITKFDNPVLNTGYSRSGKPNRKIEDVYFSYLNELSGYTGRFKILFPPDAISDIFFIYNNFLDRDEFKKNLDSKLSNSVTCYLTYQIDNKLNEFTIEKLNSIVMGIKHFPDSSKRKDFMEQLYTHFSTRMDLESETHQATLLNLVKTYMTLRSNYALKLWSKLNVGILPNEVALNVLSEMQYILPKEIVNHPEVDLLPLLNRVKKIDLTDSQFTKAFVSISFCKYCDYDWYIKGKELLSKLEEENKDPGNRYKLKKALEMQIELDNKTKEPVMPIDLEAKVSEPRIELEDEAPEPQIKLEDETNAPEPQIELGDETKISRQSSFLFHIHSFNAHYQTTAPVIPFSPYNTHYKNIDVNSPNPIGSGRPPLLM